MMKAYIGLILGGVAAVVVGVLWWEQPITSGIEAQQPRVGEVVSGRGGLAEESADYESERELRVAADESLERASEKEGVLWTLATVPDGVFREQLLMLSEEAQEQALRFLSRRRFPILDFNSMRVDDRGRIFYVCSMGGGLPLEELSMAYAAEGGGESTVSSVLVPISHLPALHSRPGASKVIFIDFDGHVITNTAWNKIASYGPVTRWDCRPYDTDGDETTFSEVELAAITQIWQRVAEDFAPFDVNVTTEQPATWHEDVCFVLVTKDVDKNGVKCPHFGYGGIAYLDTFGDPHSVFGTNDCYAPVWVMEMTVPNTAEAISHEAGHAFGLHHDGTTSLEYYYGHDNGSISWGPIMGAAYYKKISQWSKGDYKDANNTYEDDIAIIAGFLGYRPDDHGGSHETATVLTNLAAGDFEASGVIGQTGEVDVFSFTTSGGEVSISAAPYRSTSEYSYTSWGGNLDVLMELYNEEGTVVASNNPTLLATAGLSVTLPAGTYYLHIKPTGVGNPTGATPTGYVQYGSLGQYNLSGVIPFDSDGDGLPDDWEQLYFSSAVGADPAADSDGDGTDNWTEYVAGTDPTDANSFFQIISNAVPSSGTGFILTWNAVAGRIYSVSWTDDLTSGFSVIADNMSYPQNSYTDTVERAAFGNYYRIHVRLE
jgi:hypothetical protein